MVVYAHRFPPGETCEATFPLEPTRECVGAWRRFGQGRPKAARAAGRLEGSARPSAMIGGLVGMLARWGSERTMRVFPLAP